MYVVQTMYFAEKFLVHLSPPEPAAHEYSVWGRVRWAGVRYGVGCSEVWGRLGWGEVWGRLGWGEVWGRVGWGEVWGRVGWGEG